MDDNTLNFLIVAVLLLLAVGLGAGGRHKPDPFVDMKRKQPRQDADDNASLGGEVVYYRPMYRIDPDAPSGWDNVRFGDGHFVDADQHWDEMRSFPQQYEEIIHEIGIENWPAYCKEHGIE